MHDLASAELTDLCQEHAKLEDRQDEAYAGEEGDGSLVKLPIAQHVG